MRSSRRQSNGITPCLLAAALLVCACTSGSSAARSALSESPDRATVRAVEAVVRDSLFAAITRYDYDALRRALTPEFELDEDTLRLSREQLIALIRAMDGRGTFVYRFDAFNTRVVGATAWTSYWNSGTFTPAGGQPVPRRWLETAVLIRQAGGAWRIDRLHSTPIRSER
jgi:hypothetical protein